MAMESALIPCARREPTMPFSPPERRLMHYSSLQKILLVGEGDFSFSNSLASAFGDARNLFATSLDSQETVLKKYAHDAAFNLSNLRRLGALLFHQVDATCMAAQNLFSNTVFDSVVYNFPHAGFHGSEDDKKMIKQHKQLVKMFFENAKKLLRLEGEVHVSHKVSPPYTKWKLEKQAAKCGLMLKAALDFHQADYPGYMNRRGDGGDSAGSFHLGKCKTFIFKISQAPFNPWRELSHMLGKRPLNFFHKIIGGRNENVALPFLPHGAPRLPLNIRKGPYETIPVMGPCIAGLQRGFLKRKIEEDAYCMREWEVNKEIRASKRGCFGFLQSRKQIRLMAPPPMGPPALHMGPRQDGPFAMNQLRPLPLHPPRFQHPGVPMFH